MAVDLDALAAGATGGAPADDAVLRRLLASGMAEGVAREKRAMFAAAAARLLGEDGVGGERGAKAFWVPGRVEIAGKHTDYAGGRSLLAATSRGFAVVSVDRQDDRCRIFTCLGGDRRRMSATLPISPDLEPQQGHWTAYPATVIRRLARNFGARLGVDVAVECDLPESSGMSTSSAVICYMWMVLAERNALRSMRVFAENLGTEEELYSYLGFIENGQNCGRVLVGDKGVGTFGGSEDHTAIMSSEAGKIKMFSYCPTKHESTASFPPEATFVVAVSGALAEKGAGAMADYNNAAFLARDAAAAWCRGSGALPLAGDTFVEGAANLAEVVRHVRRELGSDGQCDEKVRAAISEVIAKTDDGATWGPHGAASAERYRSGALVERFQQFFDESEVITPKIAEAIAAADFEALGRWSDESHRQTVELLRNTVPETAWLPRAARRLGALGASAFGAGFGGSCWAVVRAPEAEDFARRWAEAYRAEFPRCAEASTFFVMSPGPGAFGVH